MAADTPVGFFIVKVIPPQNSPWKSKEIPFLVSAPDGEVYKTAQAKMADLTREWQGLEPEIGVTLEGPDMISDADVLEGDLGKRFTIKDLDWARKNPGEAWASYGVSTGQEARTSQGRGYDGSGETARGIMRASLQFKSGLLFWAADETIPQKPLPAGYRWVKVGDTYVQMKDDEAATLASVVALKNTTIASEFRDELYPVKAEEIKEGDRVYVRPLMRFAVVTDIKNDRYLVSALTTQNKITGPYLNYELEKR